MLPVEKAKGQVWLHEQLLCDVEYDISEPLKYTGGHQVQRIMLTVEDEHCAPLLAAYELTLVLDDGQRLTIPRPIQHQGRLECYAESPA